MRTPEAKCPHCEGRATIVGSKVISSMYKEFTYRCHNPQCGFIWVAGLEPLRTLSPSAIPRADVRIPMSQHVRIKTLQCQLALEEELHS